MEAKFGAGSDFEKRMKDIDQDIAKKSAGEADNAKKHERKGKEGDELKAKKQAAEKLNAAKALADRDQETAMKRLALTRDRRIQKLEAQIRELVDEIKKLKADAPDDQDGEK
jgi:hypothetical protein